MHLRLTIKITKKSKVLCICRKGQVRSVAARYILTEIHGFRKVLCCGWEWNDSETLAMLYKWADTILIVGRAADWDLPTPASKTIAIEVGRDSWGRSGHPKLLRKLQPMLEALL